jgi:outer membrane protein TolC
MNKEEIFLTMFKVNVKYLFMLLISAFFIIAGYSQQSIRKLTLQETLKIAQTQSADALNAKQLFRASYWEFKTFKGTYLPGVGVSATIPDINRIIEKISSSVTGLENYVPQQYTSYSANLAVTQKIGFTGGTVFIKSGLERTDNFLKDSTGRSYTLTSFLSTPINIGYTQPIFQFNAFKWDRKIQPLIYDQAKRIYIENIEEINLTTTNYFFNLLQAQIEVKISKTNLSNYDTLYRIAKGRYQLGKIAENDLLLLELNFLKAQAAVENADLALDNALFRLKSFLRIKDTLSIELVPPAEITFTKVDPNVAVAEAKNNSSTELDFSKRLLEAARDVNRAKMDGRFDADLIAVFGYNQNANTLENAYKSPLDKEQVSLGLNIPILDWGVARGKIKMAESQEEIVRNSVEQERIDFERNVYLKVVQLNMQKNQLIIAAKSDTVARKTYEVTKGRYLIGKVNSILDLNNAQMETDNSEKSYYFALQTFWRSYFELRKMTLFDFITNQQIKFNFEDVKP